MGSLYCHVVFGLKNASATYQWGMTVIFYDMLYHNLEDYTDDNFIKCKEVYTNVNDLKKLFEICRQYKLRMNPFENVLLVYLLEIS